MGDATWLLPVLRHLHTKYDAIYLETPWPQVYWSFPWIRCLKPSEDSPYASWPMFRESIESIDEWAEEPKFAAHIQVCNTGDYSTRIRSFFRFNGPCDMRFPLKPAWIFDAKDWMEQAMCADAERPRVLMHIPMRAAGDGARDKPLDMRYCDPQKFVDIYRRFSGPIIFFDAQRNVEGENEPVVTVPLQCVREGTGADAPIMWALASLADAIVTTDNHMLPIALAMKRPTLYLEGGLAAEYLLDPRIDASRVTVVRRDQDAAEGFGRFMRQVSA